MLILLLASCLKITYTTGAPQLTPPQHTEWHHRFAQGMVEVPGPYMAQAACPAGVTQLRTSVSLANSLASAAADQLGAAVGVDTSGVYSPSTIEVWCAPLK